MAVPLLPCLFFSCVSLSPKTDEPPTTSSPLDTEEESSLEDVQGLAVEQGHNDEIGFLIGRLSERNKERLESEDAARQREALIALALEMDGNRGTDCSAFVHTLYLAVGYDLLDKSPDLIGLNRTLLIHQYLVRHGTITTQSPPQPGDLVFFDDTYRPRNRPVLRGNPLTHVGIVVQVDADHTAHFLHGGNSSGRIQRAYLNLLRPDVYKDSNGKILNSYLVSRRYDPNNRLTAQRFNSFGRIIGAEHQPATEPLEENEPEAPSRKNDPQPEGESPETMEPVSEDVSGPPST